MIETKSHSIGHRRPSSVAARDLLILLLVDLNLF